MSGKGQVIGDAGFPPEIIEDEAKWADFVLHGTLHYHGGMPAGFDVEQLGADKAAGVLRFLERSLAPDIREDSGLVLALRRIVTKTPRA